MNAQLSEPLIDALTARGLCMETALRLGLRTERVAGGGDDALAIPFIQNGQEVRTKYRTFGPEKRFWQTKGGVRCAWNEDALRDDALSAQPVLITEGELDALAAIQSGFARTISVPDGAPPANDDRDTHRLESAPKYEWLRTLRPLLTQDRVPHFIIAADGDPNGAALFHDLSALLGRVRCKFVSYPKAKDPGARGRERLKDLNEVLEDYGPRGVRHVVERASWLADPGVVRMSELPPLPETPIYETGYGLFGEHYKARLGDFVVVTGIPGYGKSSLVNDLCCRLAQRHGLRTGWASFEQAPQRDHRRALRSWFNELPEWRQTDAELRAADEWIEEHHRFIVATDQDPTLEWALERMEAAVIQHGCKVLVLDPWNELDHARGRDETLTEYVGRAIKTLKKFAVRFQVHLIIVAHPTKQQREPGKTSYRAPTLYDISDSAHWYNKTDLGVVVHRPDPTNSTVTTLKSRYHEIIGTPGTVTMQYCRDTRRFVEQYEGEPQVLG